MILERRATQKAKNSPGIVLNSRCKAGRVNLKYEAHSHFALFISGALSAAINDAGLEARSDPPDSTKCSCTIDVNDHNHFYLYDAVPRGKGYIQRNAKVYDKSNSEVGSCNISFIRTPDCAGWSQARPTKTTSGGNGLCDGKAHKLNCVAGK
ncbi:hypothetical protein WAI453_003047 [Rhynchosporium graminicola]